jgi:3-mercaptopyruvate sulfurtransferase SseA
VAHQEIQTVLISVNRPTARASLATLFALLTLLQGAAALASDRLVDPAWLRARLGQPTLVLLDASPAPLQARGRITGAVAVDVFRLGAREPSPDEMQAQMRSWGISANSTVVIYDQGASFFAPRLFFDLLEHGVPAERLHLLDGGMARWLASGGTTVTAAAVPPRAGNVRVSSRRTDLRSELEDVLRATGDPAGHAVLDAMTPDYFYGASKFFDRAGHLPQALLLPVQELFNEDKTFKSPAALRAQLSWLGVRPEQQIHTYCGGGGAAAAPFFALRFIAGYQQVRMFKGSQRAWLSDARQLPMWTWAQPQMLRPVEWLAGWNHRMLRQFGAVQLSVIDIRPREAYDLGHVPFALHVPADVWRRHAADPAALGAALAAAGVDPMHEAVVVSERGVDPDAALAWALLERLGQRQVSILDGGMDAWALRGQPLTKAPTEVGAATGAKGYSVPATRYPVPTVGASGSRAQNTSAPGAAPTLVWRTEATAPASDSAIVHLAARSLLASEGQFKSAYALWDTLQQAGVTRWRPIECVADDAGEAALGCLALRLLGYPQAQARLH